MEENEAVNDAIDSSSEKLMVGFLVCRVVVFHPYQGTISDREILNLVRNQSNPSDQNAIKVLNMRSVQIGYLERSAAAILSPLIDTDLIAIEGIVPKQQSNDGRFLPCQVHIYAKIEDFDRVKQAIANCGLQLNSENKASLKISRAKTGKEKKSVGPEKSVDEIFKLLDAKVSNEEMLKELDPPKEMIKTELLPHQKEGLGWLVSRENSCDLPPFWEEKNGVYVNELTNCETDTRPEPLRGGIFADDMGLGKTLTLISLIALDKWNNDVSSSRSVDVQGDEELGEEENIVSLGKNSKRGRGTKENENSRKKKIAFDRISNFKPKSTLVVCPLSVFPTWTTQLEEHTHEGTFKVYTYYDRNRTRDAEELQKHDIVLTAYSTLATEVRWNSPISETEWRRVILDEAHIIKTLGSDRGQAVASLKAKHKWAVTGTPVQKTSSDLYLLVSMLDFDPLSGKTLRKSLLQRSIAEVDEKNFSQLQVVMATISLRRTKDKCLINLPSKTFETCYVELGEEERIVYDQVEEKAKKIVKGYISGGVVGNYYTVLGILVRLRQICTDLALCPADLVLQSSQIEDVMNNPTLLRKLVSMLQDAEDLDCSICLSPPTDIVITCCSHIFCESCILKALRRANSTCPICRHPLQQSDLFKAPPESSQTSSHSTSSSSSSCKIAALLKLLSASRTENPLRKSVVFSQFRKMLILLEEPLTQSGFKVLRLDGSMDAKRRARVIKEFGVKGGATILLASVNASYVGINLNAASRVYFMEPLLNPTVEEQAMDRVHRIGQKEDVKIVRLIARNSIEERILKVQENKRLLLKKVFAKKGLKDQKEINRDDLRALLNLE